MFNLAPFQKSLQFVLKKAGSYSKNEFVLPAHSLSWYHSLKAYEVSTCYLEFYKRESYSFRNENVTPHDKQPRQAEMEAEGEGNLEGILE